MDTPTDAEFAYMRADAEARAGEARDRDLRRQVKRLERRVKRLEQRLGLVEPEE